MGDAIAELNVEMQACFKKKEEARDQYWEARFKHREQQDLINYVNWITSTQKRVAELESDYAKERAAIENETIRTITPLKEEIRTCDFLVGLCDSQLKRAGLRQESA